MKTSVMIQSSVLLVTGALLATGCVVHDRPGSPPPPPVAVVAPPPPPTPVVLAPGEVLVTTEPPAPYMEPYPVMNRPGFLWVPGAWVWHHRWVWEKGHWVHPPYRGSAWVPGRYEMRGNVRVYVAGGWR